LEQFGTVWNSLEQFGTVWNRLTIRSPQSGANNHGKTCQGKMSPGQNVPLEVRAKCPPVGQGKMSPKKSLEVRVGQEMLGQNVSRAICLRKNQGKKSPRAICLQGSLSLNRMYICQAKTNICFFVHLPRRQLIIYHQLPAM